MIKKILLSTLVVFILLLWFGGKFGWLKINSDKSLSVAERTSQKLERYGNLEICKLSNEEIRKLFEERSLVNQNCEYKIIDEIRSKDINIYLLSVNKLQGKFWEYEGLIAINEALDQMLVDFDYVWGYFHHAKDFDLNMKTHDIEDIISHTDNGPVLSIHKNTFINRGMAEYFDKYLVTESGFSHLGSD